MIEAQQFDLFDARQLRYPHTPGFKASGTSQIAAEANASERKSLREQVLELLKTKELTPDETAMYLHRNLLSIRPRFSELVAQGKIKETGQHRRNWSGLPANVYKAV